ncbi:symporter ycgO [Estrella lausannensis]|uniref:Symporter ycgO n=2 Tax=Estrella lausannensis TaxID=483423 RepID=A0A0H5E7T4_9BACT|nr:symporter ycgO [Estrella lausannensis]
MGCYLAANLIGIGTVVEAVFGIDYTIAITVAMFVAMIYSFVGGYYTVAKVDQFQALFLLFAIFLVPLITYTHMPGGFQQVSKVARDNAIPMTLIGDSSWESIRSIIFLAMGWGLGYFGQPHIVTKFMGIKSPAELVKSKWVGMTWQVLALGFAAIVGFIGIGFFNASLYDPQLVFVVMVKELFNPLIGGFILCGLIAATLSTMDSQIIVSASVISEDFWKYFVKKHASDKELIWVSRLSVVALSFFSIYLAYSKNSTVEKAVLYAWSGLGCSFGPAIIMALYDKKANRHGAIAGIAIGGLIAGFWPSILPYISSFDIPSMIPGFFASILTIYLVSRAYAPKVVA